MTKHVVYLCLLVSLVSGSVLVGGAQEPAQPDLPRVLLIYREEVKPGRGAAHAANEAAWAGAYLKANAPQHWLGMTSVAGPSEAWFMSPHASYESLQKSEDAIDADAALSTASDKFSAQEADLLSRASTLILAYRPQLSYQPQVKMPEMRYMQVEVMQVKPGHDASFRRAWRQIAEAHTKAKMEEHWATYEMDMGGADLTFFFFYPRRTLAEIDKSGPMHGGDAYRDAVGESGRNDQRELLRDALESTRTLLFKLEPKMSLLPKDFTDGDPAFWTPPAAPVKK